MTIICLIQQNLTTSLCPQIECFKRSCENFNVGQFKLNDGKISLILWLIYYLFLLLRNHLQWLFYLHKLIAFLRFNK